MFPTEEKCIGPKSIQDGKYYVNNSSEVADTKAFKVNSTLVVKCNGGYVLAEESPTSTHCLGNGSWSWWEPTCKGIDIIRGIYFNMYLLL